MDITKFLEKDKELERRPNKERKSLFQYITLSKKAHFGLTFIYKPLLDTQKRPFRRILNPYELHINTINAEGKNRWMTYGIYGDVNCYGRLNQEERDAYNKASQLMHMVGEWGEESAWATARKMKTIFYAYALKFLNPHNKDFLESPGLTLVEHTSSRLLTSFHKVSDTKTSVFGSNSWIEPYFNTANPNHNIIVKTTAADIGMDVVVDFMERNSGISQEVLEEAATNVGDLDNLCVKNSFDLNYFKEIITVCEDWIARKQGVTSSVVIPSSIDNVQLEVASKESNIGVAVTPLGKPIIDAEILPPDIQMKS